MRHYYSFRSPTVLFHEAHYKFYQYSSETIAKWSLGNKKETEIITKSNCVEYYSKNVLHREDGPARIYYNGTQEWYRYGQLHRSNGPAVIYPDGGVEYWMYGEQL